MEQKYCPHCMHPIAMDVIQCENCKSNIHIENASHMLPIGTILHKRYLIGKCIGQGGAGITYIGLDKILKRPVAIKEYFPDSVAKRNNTVSIDILTHNDEETISWYGKNKERFLEEARILAAFAGNPNLVYVSDLFEENETAYFIMEYVDGESLHEWLKTRDKVSFDEANAMLKPLIKTISDINSQGLIHRDISPSNIMITKTGNIKLLDFGAAREYANAGEKSISIVLKPGYAPQEQYNTRGIQGPWTDVYALCATIYKMITGQVPENALNRMFEDDMPAPSQLGAMIAPAQEAVLMEGLAVRPNDRIQDMEELLKKFEAANLETRAAEAKQNPDVDEEDEDERTLIGPVSQVGSQIGTGPKRSHGQVGTGPEQPRKPVESHSLKGPGPERPHGQLGTGPKQPRKETDSVRTKKRPGKLLPAIAAALIVIALIAVFFLPKGDGHSNNREKVGIWSIDKLSGGDNSASARDTTLTADDMKQVKNCSHLYLTKCQLQQDAIDYIGSNCKARVIDMDDCSGFDTLDPLSKVSELENLYISGLNDTIYLEKGYFTTEFQNVQSLYINNAILKDGGQFLGCFKALNTLKLQDVYQLKGLPELSQDLLTLSLKSVDCNHADLTSMTACKDLKYLTLEDCNLNDISWLSGMKDLSSVDLDKNKLASLEVFAGIPISYISANGNQLTNLHGLENNANLRNLTVALNQLTDISALANDTELTLADLGKNQLTDISSLANASNMQTLKLYKNQLSDLTPISGMKELKELVISDNAFKNLDSCQQLIKLEELIAPRNQLTSIDGLQNCTVLNTVNLAGNQLTDASVLGKSADKLQILCLEDNQLTDISFLHGAAALETLSLHNNAVTSLNGLEESKALKAISAHHNAITDINALQGSDVLYYADLGNNAIQDIRGVSQKEAAKRVLVLNNNNLTDISSLRTDTEYVALALHGNNISDFSVLENLIGQRGDEEISVEWNGDPAMLDSVSAAYNGSRVDAVNVPLDKQVNMNAAFKEKYLEFYPDKNFAYDVRFYTTEEMESHLNEMRSDTIKLNMEETYEYSYVD